jgi:hypothetical protein
MLRLDPELMVDIRALAGPRGFSAAVEQGLRLWAERERRKAAKPDRLAEHLYPPSAREIAACTKGDG